MQTADDQNMANDVKMYVSHPVILIVYSIAMQTELLDICPLCPPYNLTFACTTHNLRPGSGLHRRFADVREDFGILLQQPKASRYDCASS